MKNSVVFDISPELSEETAVFPGDTALSRRMEKDCKKGDSYTLSSIKCSVHIGAHADAPCHYEADGEGIGSRSLEYYLGDCQVIEIPSLHGRILPEHLDGKEIASSRILFKTGSFPDPCRWRDEFNSLSAELIEMLAAKKVILVGIDTPSIDPAVCKELSAHQAVFRNDMAILEGIVLDSVPEGKYLLVSLPLRIKDADASPVRAVLVGEHP